ncbi:MAG: ATP-binding cassette domain-containing protein, partial [Selenomonadaceae bacterium]|nr:ATP-binding cassette domain-containing protein [Selenomonadaceae bacterium]
IWAVPIIKRKIEAVWRTGATNNAFMVESITNIETIKALAVEPQFTNKWENLLARYVRTTFENIKFRLVIGAFSGIVQVSISMAILWYGGHMVMDGLFTLGQLIAFQMISKQALDPMTKLLTMWPQVQQVGLSLERIGDILNTGMEPIVKEMGKRGDDRIDGSIEMHDVSFRYRVDLPLVLKGINLTVAPGQKIGIVGRSGSGKSTLTNLVQNLYIPESGDIIVGGVNTREANLGWLRSQIGVVMQENYLFNSSVRDNIAVSRPTATMDEIIRAARLAGAHDFILELKEGYDTKVGERGDSLSGGQRQRVAIARALLANPPILIFDEATSALDYESERIILNNMEAIGARRTMLIIAHRLSAVRKCDKIIVVDKGEIVESGTHAQLLAMDGMYRYLYNQQEGK